MDDAAGHVSCPLPVSCLLSLLHPLPALRPAHALRSLPVSVCANYPCPRPSPQASIQAGKLDLESRALENWDADVRDIYDSIPHRPNPYPPLPL